MIITEVQSPRHVELSLHEENKSFLLNTFYPCKWYIQACVCILYVQLWARKILIFSSKLKRTRGKWRMIERIFIKTMSSSKLSLRSTYSSVDLHFLSSQKMESCQQKRIFHGQRKTCFMHPIGESALKSNWRKWQWNDNIFKFPTLESKN